MGARRWKLLVEGGNPRAAPAQWQSYYEADETTLKEDLTGFIKRLQTEALLDVDK